MGEPHAPIAAMWVVSFPDLSDMRVGSVNIHGQHRNVMVEGCTVINSGDDNFAMWSIGAA